MKACVALAVVGVGLLLALLAFHRRKDPVERLYETWAEGVTPAPAVAQPNLVSHFIHNTNFSALVQFGEAAVPFCSNKVRLYVQTTNHVVGPCANDPDRLHRIKAAVASKLRGASSREVDVYLAYAIIYIKHWPISDFSTLVPPSLAHTQMARQVLAKLAEEGAADKTQTAAARTRR